MVVRPVAATGVSSGCRRVAAGTSNPRAPRSSQMPMMRTRGPGTSAIQGGPPLRSSALLFATLLQPTMAKATESEPCRSQRTALGERPHERDRRWMVPDAPAPGAVMGSILSWCRPTITRSSRRREIAMLAPPATGVPSSVNGACPLMAGSPDPRNGASPPRRRHLPERRRQPVEAAIAFNRGVGFAGRTR